MEDKDISNEAPIEQMHMEPQNPFEILCVYANPDESFYIDLKKSLILGERAGMLVWLETRPGDDTSVVLPRFLKQAAIIILLLSPDFFASDDCYMTMKAALQEQTQRQVQVVPVLVRPSGWKISACKNLRVLPDNEQPIDQWPSSELAYENIRIGLARLHSGLGSAFPLSKPVRSSLFRARDIPKGYILRLDIFTHIKSLLLEQHGSQTMAITTALRGAGGFGKTTLALALCHDPEIQDAFPDGIFWIELGEQPPRPLNLLNSLLTALEESSVEALVLEEAQQRWQAALRNRVSLLVIDDVWQTEALVPLLEGGPDCARLVTTRNDNTLPMNVARVWVDAMTQEEAIAVLCEELPDEIRQLTYRATLERLVNSLNCWPLLLALARGMLFEQVRYGRSVAAALQVIEQAYQKRGVMAFDLSNENEREYAAGACLETSLRHLGEFTNTRYHAVERYQELAVFPDNVDIPLSTLQRFWKGTGGLETWETEDLCMRLHRLSLLLTCDLGTSTIRLHAVMRNYLQQRTDSGLSQAHARFLDIHRHELRLAHWANLLADESYLWLFLTWHLCQASRWEELHAMFTNLYYLAKKALIDGVAALEADILLASSLSAKLLSDQDMPDTSLPDPSFFSLLHRMIVRASHLLRQAPTLEETEGLLLSHLGWEPMFTNQWAILERTLPRPFLVAWHPLPGKVSSALLRTLRGHTGAVTGCAISPDGTFIVSASSDCTLKVWNAVTGVEQFSLLGHTHRVTSCAISPDGCFIISASDDNTLRVWDAVTGSRIRSLQGHSGSVTSCAISPDGSFIVSASSDGTLKVWDTATGSERFSLRGHTGAVRGCAISPDGSFIVSVSNDSMLKIWDVATGIERTSLQSWYYRVTDCAISPDERFIVSASDDRTLKVWDVATGSELFSLQSHTGPINGCAISPDGGFIVSASADNMLKVWDAVTGNERLSLRGHTNWVTDCAVSPDGRFIVSASSDSTLKVWEVDTVIAEERLVPQGHTGPVNGCAISPDGSFCVSASSDETLKVWDTATGKERLSLQGHLGAVRGCAISSDSSLIISASSDKTLKVWDVTTGEVRFSLSGHTNWVNSCAISPDGSYIASASSDETLKVWDAITGKERFSLRGHIGVVRDCVISPDGSYIVSASSDETLKVWGAATGKERFSLKGYTSVINSCVISPDGDFIISASGDKTLKIWDTATRKERLSFEGHIGSVTGCAISPDGHSIISTSSDSTLKVWDAHTGQCVLTFPVDRELSGCAFHPDGEHLVACGVQGMYFLRLIR